MYIVDPQIRLNKRLDVNEKYCPLVSEIISPEEVSYDFMKDVMKEATLRMYRNGYPAAKNLDPVLLENTGINSYMIGLYEYLKNKAKKESEGNENGNG